MKFETTMYVCDNPTCTKSRPAAPGDDGPPEGYHGTVLNVHAGGGDSAEFFACQDRCIGPAVRAAFDRRPRAWDEETG